MASYNFFSVYRNLPAKHQLLTSVRTKKKNQYATFRKINNKVGHNHQTFSVNPFENILLLKYTISCHKLSNMHYLPWSSTASGVHFWFRISFQLKFSCILKLIMSRSTSLKYYKHKPSHRESMVFYILKINNILNTKL